VILILLLNILLFVILILKILLFLIFEMTLIIKWKIIVLRLGRRILIINKRGLSNRLLILVKDWLLNIRILDWKWNVFVKLRLRVVIKMEIRLCCFLIVIFGIILHLIIIIKK